jgi:DNA polymerase-3 subunit delta'
MDINESVDIKLLNAINHGRLSHTYMFEGDTIETLRRKSEFFALKILGETERNSKLLNEGNHPDFYYLRTDETTIKKEDVEQLVRVMHKKPTESEYKVYVIEAFEKLTPQAENSLLKFLEEPPEKTIAILLTIDKSSILPTIHSRAQHVFIKGESKDRLKELSFLTDEELTTVDVLSLNAEHIKQLEDHFSVLRQKAMAFSSKWVKDDPLVLIEIKGLLEACSERRDYRLLLQLIDGYIRQTLHQTIGLNDFKPYPETASNQIKGEAALSKMLEEVAEANRLIQFNVNPALTFEGMVISSKG